MNSKTGEEVTVSSINDIEVFKILTEHFRQDVREFWARSNFYLLAQAVLFSVFVVTYSTSTVSDTVLSMAMSGLGLIIALFWFIVLRGSIQWIQLWREQVIRLDKELDRFQYYVEVESFAKKKPLLSPSYITQFLPIVFIIIWLAVLIVIFLTSDIAS